MKTDAHAFSGDAEARPVGLRCPFCDTFNVEAKQVQGHRPSGGDKGGEPVTGSFGQVIYELQLYCRNCSRGYRQTCPERLLPEGLTHSC